MKTVPLHGKVAAGRVALVDDDDYDLVMAYRWFVVEKSRSGVGRRRDDGPYAKTTVRHPDGHWTTARMHSLLTGWPQTDHKDHDGLNNQRSNLRPATQSQNAANQRPMEGRTSQYKGVSWKREYRKWLAKITIRKRGRHLGYFAVEEDAARAYDAAALAAWGEFACLNFPLSAR